MEREELYRGFQGLLGELEGEAANVGRGRDLGRCVTLKAGLVWKESDHLELACQH